MMSTQTFRLGSRASLLAIAQTRIVQEVLAARNIASVIRKIHSQGDLNTTQTILSMGGKGFFVKKIDQALRDGDVDVAVHSLKDVEVNVAPAHDGQEEPVLCAAFMSRWRHDVLLLAPHLVNHKSSVAQHIDGNIGDDDSPLLDAYTTLDMLPQGSVVGTSAPRRTALLLSMRPDLRVVAIRGNVPSRLDQLRAGRSHADASESRLDAIVVAACGLERLNQLGHMNAYPLDPHVFVPASCQGLIGAYVLPGDTKNNTTLRNLGETKPLLIAQTEQSFVRHIGGDCHTPLGVWCRYRDDENIDLRAVVLSADGQHCHRLVINGVVNTMETARATGKKAAQMMLENARVDWLDTKIQNPV